MKLERHDGEIKLILDAIRKLMAIRALPHKKNYGSGKERRLIETLFRRNRLTQPVPVRGLAIKFFRAR
jgi:hypothetical protein